MLLAWCGSTPGPLQRRQGVGRTSDNRATWVTARGSSSLAEKTEPDQLDGHQPWSSQTRPGEGGLRVAGRAGSCFCRAPLLQMVTAALKLKDAYSLEGKL